MLLRKAGSSYRKPSSRAACLVGSGVRQDSRMCMGKSVCLVEPALRPKTIPKPPKYPPRWPLFQTLGSKGHYFGIVLEVREDSKRSPSTQHPSNVERSKLRELSSCLSEPLPCKYLGMPGGGRCATRCCQTSLGVSKNPGP